MNMKAVILLFVLTVFLCDSSSEFDLARPALHNQHDKETNLYRFLNNYQDLQKRNHFLQTGKYFVPASGVVSSGVIWCFGENSDPNRILDQKKWRKINAPKKKKLPVWRSAELEHLILYRQWEKPVCILFRVKNETNTDSSPSSVLEPGLIEKTVRTLQKSGRCNGWTFGTFYTNRGDTSSKIATPASDNMLRCYLGTASPIDHEDGATLKKWLKKMEKMHEDRLSAITNSDLDLVFQKNTSTQLYIVVFPGNYFFGVIEPVLLEVRRYCASFCKLFIIGPETRQERTLSEKFDVKVYPTILLFHRRKERMKPIMEKKLEGIHAIQSKEEILLKISIIQLQDIALTSDNFTSTALNTRSKTSPLVVCFFSSLNPVSYLYLYGLQRSLQHFAEKGYLRSRLRFGMVDISEPRSSNIISRHLDVTEIRKLPFLVMFWQVPPNTGSLSRFEIKTDLIHDVIPTPWNLEVILDRLNIPQSKIPKCSRKFQLDLFCSANVTQSCSLGDYPQVFYGPVWDPNYKTKKRPVKKSIFKKLNGIPLLTDLLWARVIERTSINRFAEESFFKKAERIQALKLVIFIMADCGYCEIMMPSFARLSKAAKNIHGVSVYMMNCTANPVQCKANGVNGYPTLALFRSVSEEESQNCLLGNSTSSSVRLDYHGDLQVDAILAWLSKAAMSAVNMQIKVNPPKKMTKDVRLTAYLYTRAQSRKYLSRSLQQKLIPFQCFKLACEKLFGTVECVARESSDVEMDTYWNGQVKETDLVLEQVVFERIDGVKSKIFKLSYPMENSLAEDKETELHHFHRKHRYSIPSGFKCENNHPLCMHILMKFVEDHSRLPITHITREGFHTHSSSSSIFLKEFPLLIALVHKPNVSENSSFLQELNRAAKNLYAKMMFSTLNVDEFPSWASQFVPRDYHYKNHEIQEEIPALYHYPRICIINWSDHQRAAFYPPIEDLDKSKNVRNLLSNIRASHIVDFAERYLADAEAMSVETEMF